MEGGAGRWTDGRKCRNERGEERKKNRRLRKKEVQKRKEAVQERQ